MRLTGRCVVGELTLELLQRVRDAIADEGTPFDMGQWGVAVSPRTWWPANQCAPADCGTPACIAGWAIRIGQRRRRSPPPRARTSGYSNPHIEALASRLLGLDGNILFYRSFWPDWAIDLPERQGALALLDALMAEQDPWSDDYVGAM